MKRKIISTILSGALLVSTTLLPISASAETTYASANDFIEDVLKTAVSNIASSTKEASIESVISNVTITGDEVFYEGNSIGYWFSDDSDCLYRDTGKTEVLIEDTGNGYAIDSALLSEFLTDVNDGFVETYEPTSTDWSKIIGKYDVTLGNTVIPMSNWIDIADATDGNYVNISRITGITVELNNTVCDTVAAFSWLVDQNGELYISSGVEVIGGRWSINEAGIATHKFGDSEASSSYAKPITGMRITNTWITLEATKNTSSLDTTFSFYSNASLTDKQAIVESDESYNVLCNINDPSITYTGTIDDAKNCGVAYYILNDFNYPNNQYINKDGLNSSLATEHNNFWTTFETTKTVKGNSTLVKRLSKISNLGDSDVLVVSPTGWTVNGTDVDIFLGTQSVTDIDGTADMGVAVEVESKNFKVTLPTTLPVYVKQDGTVATATNATILNESNAPIQIKDVDINAKPSNDWTFVDTTPSQDADAKEFTFSTSLNVGDVMNAGANLPFTYDAAFSPEILKFETLDAATVSLTFGWAS